MHVIDVRNVQQALPEGLRLLQTEGQLRETRNGKALVVPGPVTTLFRKPRERVLFWPARDANPFLHLMECLWMISGRDDVAFLSKFSKNMANYSDDGVVLHGAYGKRWRDWFHPADGIAGNADQLNTIVQKLHDNPDDRRCVLSMWDGFVDLCHVGKDLPCNTHIYFSRDKDGALDMTVCNRSNDVIWGAYGANAVHMSFLQEFMASAIGCPVGRYWQMSNNYHAYVKVFEPISHLADEAADTYRGQNDPYEIHQVEPFPIVSTPVKEWQQDLLMFLSHGPIVGLRDPFFRRVVGPMWHAHGAFSAKSDPDRFDKALEIMDQCKASDWRVACLEWIVRRQQSYNLKRAQAA